MIILYWAHLLAKGAWVKSPSVDPCSARGMGKNKITCSVKDPHPPPPLPTVWYMQFLSMFMPNFRPFEQLLMDPI